MIDANTRDIKIPKQFEKHVGVLGDNVSEIIYFAIDRYFDAADLMDMAILIQWRHGPNDLNEYFDLPYKRSIDYKPGYIVFGWPISEQMSSESGDIIFSVRFYKIDPNDNLLYSFSTKPATIKIANGLNFTLTDSKIRQAYDYSDLIYRNLREAGQSPLVPTYLVATPQFENSHYFARATSQDDYVLMDSDKTYNLPQQFKVHANLSLEDLNKNKKKSLNGLTYQWYHELDGKVEAYDDNFVYELLPKNTTLLNNEYYYYKDGENNYHLFDNKQPATDIDLYLKYAYVEPDHPGDYFVKAINRYSGNNAAEMDSVRIHIPVAEPLLLLENYPTEFRKTEGGNGLKVLAEDSQQPVNKNAEYYWYFSENENINLLEPCAETATIDANLEGYYRFKAVNTFNKSNTQTLSDVIRVLYAASPISLTANFGESIRYADDLQLTISATCDSTKGNGTISYQWQKYNGSTWDDIEGATNNIFTPPEAESTVTYRCYVTNNYVGDISHSEKTVDVYR